MKRWGWLWPVLMVCGVGLSAGLYLGALGWLGGAFGFPLDDAYIHQTYARNLAEEGRWSYESGRPSSGSTAPLWTLALTPAYLLGIDHRLWAYVLGAATLAWLAWLARRMAVRLFGDQTPVTWLAALFCIFEWHLVWAAFSGMETLMFAALLLTCLSLYLTFESRHSPHCHCEGSEANPAPSSGDCFVAIAPRNDRQQYSEDSEASSPCSGDIEGQSHVSPEPTSGGGNRRAVLSGLAMGVCAALLVFTRPEGLLALGLMALAFASARVRHGLTRRDALWAATAALGCLVLLVPYIVFNLRTGGLVFPSTFYAKQAEYRSMIESLSLPARLGHLLLAVWAGPQLLLVPGFVFSLVAGLRERRLEVLLLWAWWLCAIGVYALRLPVAYQHGRYLMPTIPVFVVLGLWGVWELVRRLSGARAGWAVGRAWLMALAAVALLFWAVGGRAYVADVGFVQGEMGAVAAWLDENVAPHARLAVHDIGLVGYRLRRPFIDLAGLVTPEVIPFIDDADRLLDFMRAQGVEYIVVFPDWSPAYRRMVSDPRLTLVYDSGYAWTRAAGHENLSVYRADWSAMQP